MHQMHFTHTRVLLLTIILLTARMLSLVFIGIAVVCRNQVPTLYMRESASPCMLILSCHWAVSTVL